MLRGCVPRVRTFSTQVVAPEALRRFGVHRVRPWLAEALAAANFKQPSAIQAAAMPRLSKREDVVIHAPTGSGKTLAYLVPVLSRLEPRTPFQLLVRGAVRTLTVDDLCATDDVAALLAAVERKTRVPHTHAWLSYVGQRLAPGR